MSRLRALWWRIAGSLWFVPALMVIGAVLLAAALVEAGALFGTRLGEHWPRLFGAAADGARGMLTAIAGSMITVAGTVFSVTIVALSLASSQYSPRLLRNFMNDRPTQVVLGVFVGIFAYCLVVLRTIRGGDESDGGFVPSIAVLAGLVLAFVGIAFLVYFIHHLASSIQAASILERVTVATLRSMEDLFPESLGAPAGEEEAQAAYEGAGPWTPVAARMTGYIVSVDNDGLIAFARERGRLVRMDRAIGEFVIEGLPLAALEGSEAISEADQKALNACYACSAQRTIEQDAGFGVQQIVDVGVKALSPGINDPSTAVQCIDRLTQILVRLAVRRIETPLRRDGDDRLRVIAAGPSFASLVDLAYAELRAHSRGVRRVQMRLQWSVAQVGAATVDAARRRVLEREARCLERLLQVPEGSDSCEGGA